MEQRCVVVGCERNFKTEFIAAECGELVGRQWSVGDIIRLCWGHAHLYVYKSIGGPETMDADD